MYAMAKAVLRIELPEAIVSKYERQAKYAKKSLEEMLSKRLISCVQHSSEKPIYISDERRQTIERLLRRNLDNSMQLIEAIERLVDVDVGGTKIDIPPQVLERVKTRTFGRPYRQVLSEEVVTSLERFTGMR